LRLPSIALLTHLRQGLHGGYFLAAIAEHFWKPAGVQVLVQQGLRDPPPADLAILHIDLTVVPQDYIVLGARYPRTLNGRAVDISKRRVSENLLSEEDDYDGPVIVKSDLNHGGVSERQLRGAARGRLGRALHQLLERNRGGTGGRGYRIFERREQVPRRLWRDRRLVIEPLYLERVGRLYAMNQWFFLGDVDIVSPLLAPTPLVAMASVAERLPLHSEVPEALRRRRAELGFDYGKFDYIVHEGRPRLLDANRTPHLDSDSPLIPRIQAICGALAGGLESCLAAAKGDDSESAELPQ
jgi:hypothetical protein